MKKTIILLAVLVFCGFGIFSCGKTDTAEQSNPAEPISLTYSIFFPPTHGQCKAGMDWAKEIEKKTNGRVKINVFPGGTLTKAKECYNGVTKGISDIGMSCFAYTRGRFPLMEAVDLPLGYPSGRVATRVANAFYDKMKPKELEDVKVLYLHAHGPGLLHTQKPVRSLEDIKSMKIRSTGLSAKVVKALGGVPVAMPQGSTYEALQKGVVEGTFAPIETLKGWRQAEVVKYTTDCFDIGYTTTMFVVMNKDKWNALPDDIKQIFEKVSKKWITVHAETWDAVDVEGRKYTQSLGNEIITLSDAENKKWVAAVAPIISGFIETANQKGLAGEKAVAELKNLIKTYGLQK